MKVIIYILTTILFLPLFGIIMFIPVLNIYVISKLIYEGEEEEE